MESAATTAAAATAAASSAAVAVEWPDALRDLVPLILSYLATPDVTRCSGACALFREASKQLTASGCVRLDASVSARQLHLFALTQLARNAKQIHLDGCRFYKNSMVGLVRHLRTNFCLEEVIVSDVGISGGACPVDFLVAQLLAPLPEGKPDSLRRVVCDIRLDSAAAALKLHLTRDTPNLLRVKRLVIHPAADSSTPAVPAMNTIMFSELRVFDASSGALRQPARVLGEVYGARTATRKMMAALMQFVFETTTLEKLLLCSCPLAFMGSEDIDDGDWEFQDGGVGALWSGLAPSGLAESYPTLSLVRALATNTSLLELDLSCCQADAAAGRELGATVARHPTLRSLNVAHNPLLDAGAAAIADGAVASKSLRHLRMPFTGAADGCCAALALTLRPADASAGLETLVLSGCNVTAAGVASLAAVGGVLPPAGEEGDEYPMRRGRLRVLDLSANHLIGGAGARAIAKALGAPSLRHLRELRLGGCAVGASAAGELVAALPRATALRSVDLSANGLKDEGAWAVAWAFDALPATLGELDLSSNGIEDDGALELAGALADNGRPPRTIDLRDNVFEPGSRAGEALASCAGVRLGGARRENR